MISLDDMWSGSRAKRGEGVYLLFEALNEEHLRSHAHKHMGVSENQADLELHGSQSCPSGCNAVY